MSNFTQMKKSELADLAAQQAKVIEDLRQRLEALESAQAPVANSDDLAEQNQRLMLALLAEREAKRLEDNSSTLYRVENVAGASVSFTVTEAGGQKRHVRLEQRGSFVNLTEKQIREVQEKSPHFFEKGFLSAPDVIEDGPNVIRDIDAFVAGLPHDQINERIGQIDSLGTLWSIFNHIENLRFVHEDERGRALVEEDIEGDLPVLREKEIDQRLLAIELAVQRRIAALGPERNAARISMND